MCVALTQNIIKKKIRNQCVCVKRKASQYSSMFLCFFLVSVGTIFEICYVVVVAAAAYMHFR